MPEPKPKSENKEQTQEPVEFLERVRKLNYPFADVSGKVVIVSREEKELLSLGFMDANGRKQICLTATKELWKKVFTDALEYINKG